MTGKDNSKSGRAPRSSAGKSIRDSRTGRFVPGNPGGGLKRGRTYPRDGVRSRLVAGDALLSAWSRADIVQVAERMLASALGSPAADYSAEDTRLFLHYAVGKPTPRLDEATLVSREELIPILATIADAINIELAPHPDLRERVVRRITRGLEMAGIRVGQAGTSDDE